MTLSKIKLREFRSRGHQLKPVVTVGNAGLSDAVFSELESTLDHHELMKVKLPAADRTTREQLVSTLCSQLNAQLIQSIGRIALIYRPKDSLKN